MTVGGRASVVIDDGTASASTVARAIGICSHIDIGVDRVTPVADTILIAGRAVLVVVSIAILIGVLSVVDVPTGRVGVSMTPVGVLHNAVAIRINCDGFLAVTFIDHDRHVTRRVASVSCYCGRLGSDRYIRR